MAGTFKFELVIPERILISEDAEQVVVPGSEGDFTVLAGHAPVMSTLRPGLIEVKLPTGQKRLFVRAGFAEVIADGLTVLAEHALDVADLTPERLAAEIERAESDRAAAKDERTSAQAAAAVERLKSLQREIRA
ncbi:MAG TPA: F0F1 ATP synthase subunit epsilon [Hyphomicrobiaceae bacterium]|nr:F0F1 ATP synthase subunit epsilon [Hyphomicrobiaceae bacterium]